MKKKMTLCFWILQIGSLSIFAQTKTSTNHLTILNEYGDTLKPISVRYKQVQDTIIIDCRSCKEESGINLSKLTPGAYTLLIKFNPPIDPADLSPTKFSIQIPLDKDTLVVSTLPKSIIESGEPSQVITAEQLALSGKNTLEEALVYLLPSFYASWQIMADKSEFFTPTSMKGMGPDQFLVLINGKRRHATSVLHLNGTFGRGTVSNDLVNIPISSVKAIEVKNAAASVWHGSDAIAGVINIQLHDEKPTTSNFGMQGGFYPSGFGHPNADGTGQWWSKNGLGNEKEGKIHFNILEKIKKDF
jgi:TonB-dependent Receptor Plug Domain